MRHCVTVSVAARLHLGFLDLNGGLGRRFGSLGLALEEPDTLIEVSRSDGDAAMGPQADRALPLLARIVERLGLPAGHSLRIHRAIPPHAGLGSGTQLALGIAAAVRRLHRLAVDVEADALLLDRSARSGLGAGFFHEGGLALDGGRGEAERPAPIVARLPFPEGWRVLLIFDPARQGVHGPAELAAFRDLAPFPADLAGHLCRLALMQALPAIAEGEIGPFGKAVTEIQAHVGDHFAGAQGGRYASPNVAAALDLLARRGVDGYGQSSWGPTGFAFAASEAEARRLQRIVAPLASSSGLETRIVRGRNHGALVAERGLAREQGARHG